MDSMDSMGHQGFPCFHSWFCIHLWDPRQTPTHTATASNVSGNLWDLGISQHAWNPQQFGVCWLGKCFLVSIWCSSHTRPLGWRWMKYVKFPVEQKTHRTEAEASNSSNHASCGLCHLEAVVGVALVDTWRQLWRPVCSWMNVHSLEILAWFQSWILSWFMIIKQDRREPLSSLICFPRFFRDFWHFDQSNRKNWASWRITKGLSIKLSGFFPINLRKEWLATLATLVSDRMVVRHLRWRCHFEIL